MDKQRFEILMKAFYDFVKAVRPQGLIPGDQVANVSRGYVEGFLETERAVELEVDEKERETLSRLAKFICAIRTEESLADIIEHSLCDQPWISAMFEAIRLKFEGKMTGEDALRAIRAIIKDAREEMEEIE